MNAWYAVMCKPRQEAVAEANLLNQGYRVYLPRLATQSRRKGKWMETVEPLFPRYLFVAPNDDRQGISTVRSTLGVCDLVRFGGQPATVPATIMEAIRERHDPNTGTCARRERFKSGEAVAFADGPFAGLNGIFDIATGENRAFVLLEMLGKINKVRVCRDWLVPAA